jgi:DNA-binding response OmpR family regulator
MDSSMAPTRPTVLVVADNAQIRELLNHYLLQEGFRVLIAGNGYDAQEVCREQKVGVVLMDICLPGLDGPATLRALRVIAPGILCCFMSGNPDPYDPLELKMIGGAYLHKPFSLHVLGKTLLDLLNPESNPDAGETLVPN